MSWAGLVRGSCALLLVAGGSRWPGTGPLEPWERAGGLQAGTKRQWRHRGVHVSPRTSVCRDTCVPGLGHMCCTRGAGVPARVHPHPTRSPPPTPALGHFLLRQNCCFFLLVNLTHNLMSGSDFPLPRPGDGLNPPNPLTSVKPRINGTDQRVRSYRWDKQGLHPVGWGCHSGWEMGTSPVMVRAL